MSDYQPPIRDMLFVMTELAGLESVLRAEPFAGIGPEIAESVLEEAGKFAREILAPLNQTGDAEGAKLTPDGVKAPAGFKEAMRRLAEDGWVSLSFPEAEGGQSLPALIDIAVTELIQTANLSFAMCPGLSSGAAGAIRQYGSAALQDDYLPRLASGEFTAAMCLTEPQSGSDLSGLKTQAIREGDHYRITGQKIFISWGDHDMSDNILHLVLARTPDAPPGTRGISLFLVPKFLTGADGVTGERNDFKVVGIEAKLGLHASPTCTLSYGDNGGAVGYLIGEEHQGLAAMFVMMNHARLQVGLQGVSLVERAYQSAKHYAHDRVQGRLPDAATPVPIVRHADVKRMLALMSCGAQAMRAVAYVIAGQLDLEQHAETPEQRRHSAARVGVLTPVFKGWCSELTQELTGLAVQVHGGMGFVEETGVAQYLRDARILTIYEGTSGIQAMDLVGRKLLRDEGAAMQALIADMQTDCRSDELQDTGLRDACGRAVDSLRQSVAELLHSAGSEPTALAAVAFDFMMQVGYTVAGWQMLRAAAAAQALLANGGDAELPQQKLAAARFYAQYYLPRADSHALVVRSGGTALSDLEIAAS